MDKGERGDQGQRGVGGERGPKGDHGQEGSRGKEGHVGAIGPRGRGVVALFFITCCFITFTLWVGERDSCMRQSGVRAATRTFIQTALEARTNAAKIDLQRHDMASYKIDHDAALRYKRSLHEAHELDCGGLFPDTN